MKLLFCLLALVCCTFTSAADLPRVAVVPDSPEPSIAAFADFLSASLAKSSTQYALVERAELTRLASEAEVQKLAADQRPAALAKLAKADGLIIVGTDKGDPKQPKLTLRLTSTNNGLVLRSFILGGKQDEYPKAAELAAGVLRFPCERLTHGDAKPPVIVSLLGIRPAFEIDRALETTLNLAVAQQLSGQSGIAVSERWKMNDLVFERSLADEIPQSFATGTILLDGSYTRKGDQLEFFLRLRKAEAEAGKTFPLQGPANKPVELAQQIAKIIATEAGQSGEVLAWDVLKEGKEYSVLGQWLFERELYEPAAQACESAVALGFSGDATLWNRSYAYMEMIGLLDRPEVGGLEQLHAPEFKRRVGLAIRKTQCVLELLDANWAGCLKTRNFHERNLFLEWQDEADLIVLQAICLRKEQLILATEARSLRALTREMVGRGNKEFKNNFGDNEVRRCYMFDSPEETAVDLRRLLHPKNLTYVHWCKSLSWRFEFWRTCGSDGFWRMVDWSTADNRGGQEAWKRFIDEMRTSEFLLNRVDACAFAFGQARNDQERMAALEKLYALLEKSRDELMTPEGQKSFYTLAGVFLHWDGMLDVNLSFETNMSKLFIRLFKGGEWLAPPTISAANYCLLEWYLCAKRGNPVIPEPMATEMLDALEAYTRWAKADSRWKTQYQNPNFVNSDETLKEMTGLIMSSYPNIKKQRAAPSKPVPGAVAIRGWKPEFPGAPPDVWMSGSFITPRGETFFVPSLEQGILEIDARSWNVKRVVKLPHASAKFLGGFARNDDLFMVNMDNRLYVTPASSDGGAWSEVVLPDVTGNEGLDWKIEALGPEFFVGSSRRNHEERNPTLLAGKVRDGKLTWLVASNRRPAVNPLDAQEPRDVTMAYRNFEGKTIMMLGYGKGGGAPILELETGKEVSSLHPGSSWQIRGDRPIAWGFNNHYERIDYLATLDPASGKPRMIFCSDFAHWAPGLPEFWKGVQPVYDYKRKEFLGQSIAPIIHAGYLWILRLEPRISGEEDRPGPNDFRLVRLGLNGGDPVVIPLRLDVPASMLSAKTGDRVVGPMLPVINKESFAATPHGLVFALLASRSGIVNMNYEWAFQTGKYVSPLLFHITWDDVHAWLAKNAPETAKPAPEAAKPASP